ncbi:MAG: hypothetical protein ACE5I7_19065 [Candidatus Binatia bacterium]
MRHIFMAAIAGSVLRLAGRVAQAPGSAGLVAPAGRVHRGAARPAGAGLGTVAIPAITEPAEEEDLPAVGSRANDKSERLHASPRATHEGVDNRRDLCDG